MVLQVILIALIIGLVWIAILTYYLRRLTINYNTVTDGVNKKNLDTVLVNIIKSIQGAKKDIAKLVDRCDTIEIREKSYIQKVGLLRFNPFKDTGGEQSFIMTLVDSKSTGVIITALYSRTGMRWYVKQVIEGSATEHQLSDEEKKALKFAKTYE